MKLIEVLKIVLWILTGVIPALVAFFVKAKAYKEAKTDKEKEAAKNELLETATGLIQSAEKTYSDINDILKAQGKSAGAVKKDIVLTKLQAYAIDKGFSFDAEYWSEKVDEIVQLTRSVNSK